jgi:hypothetical protein
LKPIYFRSTIVVIYIKSCPNYCYIPYQINNRMKIPEWLNVILDRSKRMLNLGLLRANGAVLVETGTIEEKLVGNMTYF